MEGRVELNLEQAPKKERSSNLELYRIIVMLLIVAHHYVVNSGLMNELGPVYSNIFSWRSVFLMLFGAWGKTGINCFVLITGYFMCKSSITLKKYVKLIAEVLFYSVVIYLIFCIFGYESFSIVSLVKAFIPIKAIQHNFTGCFLAFYLFIPFLNVLVRNLTEKQHIALLLLCGFVYVFFGTMPFFDINMNYVSWYIVLYFVASYIRLYPKKIYDSTKIWLFITLFFVMLLSVSVIACAYVGERLNKQMVYYFAADSNTFLALAVAVSSFILFKNLKIKQSRFINTVSASTFGVLLIHAHSETMRNWLWRDTLKNVQAYSSDWLVLHAIGSVIAVFVICTVIDFARIMLLEKPFMKLFDKNKSKIDAFCKKIEDGFFKVFHIE